MLGIYEREKDYEKVRHLVLVNTIALSAVFVLIIISIISYFRGDTVLAVLDLMAAGLLVACIIIMRRSGKPQIPIYVGISIITALYFFLFFTGGADGTGFIWYYTYPFFSFYIMGKRDGAIANILLLTPSFIYLLTIWNQEAPLYSQNFTIRFIPSILCALIFSYLFESTRNKTHNKLEASIAELRNKEAELKKAHDSLETKVEKRTRALKTSNENLRIEIEERKRSQQMQKQLEAQLVNAKKMQAIGTLAGGVAHDLNNILSGLTTYPEVLLLKLPPDSPMRSPLKTIRASGIKAANIVQDLLTLSRRGVADFEIVDLARVVSDYLKSPECTKMLSFHSGVSIASRIANSPLTISGSDAHLSKAIMNLVTNAAEAMPDGGTLRVSVEGVRIEKGHGAPDELKPGKYVKLAVSDTGNGIPPHVIDRIYEPFFTTKKMGRSGTGLGMAVVWGTVQDHDGHITVQSTAREGTTFELWFPAAGPDDPLRTIETVERPKGNNASVLVVDDVAEQREIATMILEEFGYAVHSVASGEAAIAYLEENDADLVLLDMTMDPGINGLETFRRIQQFKPDQRAIIASGYSDSKLIQSTLQLGVHSYLKKPYTIESISKTLRAILKES